MNTPEYQSNKKYFLVNEKIVVSLHHEKFFWVYRKEPRMPGGGKGLRHSLLTFLLEVWIIFIGMTKCIDVNRLNRS